MTALQVGRPGRYGLTCFENLLPGALRGAGHEVEQRPVVPGEPLGGYDAVLVGVLGPSSIGARNPYRWGALDAVARARAEGCGLGLYLTDWEVRRIDRDLRYLLKERERLNSGMKGRDLAWAKANLDHLLGAVEVLRDEPWPVTLVPKFTWGNGDLLLDAVNGLNPAKAAFLDPSSLVPQPTAPVYPQRDRHERWVVAALAKLGREWAEQLWTRWPKAVLRSRVPEAEYAQALGACAGALVWPHDHAGSGWWRIRYVHSAQMGAVICADRADVGDQFGLDPAEVEALTPDQREALAVAQRAGLESVAWPVERFTHEADLALKRIASDH